MAGAFSCPFPPYPGDVVLAVRADEVGHRDVNHDYANQLSGAERVSQAA
ncbi:alternative oxidase [Cupriavidus sp. 2SB]|nr:alternative oxidase [Cupriavidus sp. 2SB]